jgi:outer membrane autotransporter protein
MVHSANDLDGVGATVNTLDLTEQELAGALQQLATEEIATPRTMATETSSNQLSTLAGRLTALRGGATGFAASGLGFAGAEQRLGAETLGLIPRAGERGGAAAADEAFSKLSGFINGIVSSGDKDATDREDGFDFDTVGITLGVDYRFTDKFVFGGALDFADTDTDFDDRGNVVAGGDVESDGFTLSGYGTYYLNKYYIDGIVSFGEHDHDITRRIFYTAGPGAAGTAGNVDRTATGDTESDLFSLTIGGGYETSRDALTYGAYARLSYLEVDIDGYTEQGALGLDLIVDDQKVKSLVSIIGGRISKAFSRRSGVLIPQGWVEWHHEFEDDSETIVTRYLNDPNALSLLVQTDDPDEDFFVLGGGVSAVFKGGTQAFVDIQTVLELEDVTNTILTAGVRREF